MASKRKPKKKTDPDQITVLIRPDEDEGLFLARTALRPTVQAAVTLKEYDKSYGDPDLNGLIAVLTEQTKASNDGDLGRAVAMLTTQHPMILARKEIKISKTNYWSKKMANGWTPERRARQAKLIQQWRPWEKSPGPKTKAGKEMISQNVYKGGSRKLLRELTTALREQRRQLNT